MSSCMMGSEGFSWCDTEHLFFRDDHWFDWDVCSLCHKGREHERKQHYTHTMTIIYQYPL